MPRQRAPRRFGERDVAEHRQRRACGGQTNSALARTAAGGAARPRALAPLSTVPARRLAGARRPRRRAERLLPARLGKRGRCDRARPRATSRALCARNDTRKLVALLPVVSAWRAYKIPLPVLVSADPYGDLGTPLIDGAQPLRRRARPADAGAHIRRARDRAAPRHARGRGDAGDHAPRSPRRALRRTCCAPNSAPVSMRRATRTNCCATRSAPRS